MSAIVIPFSSICSHFHRLMTSLLCTLFFTTALLCAEKQNTPCSVISALLPKFSFLSSLPFSGYCLSCIFVYHFPSLRICSATWLYIRWYVPCSSLFRSAARYSLSVLFASTKSDNLVILFSFSHCQISFFLVFLFTTSSTHASFSQFRCTDCSVLFNFTVMPVSSIHFLSPSSHMSPLFCTVCIMSFSIGSLFDLV